MLTSLSSHAFLFFLAKGIDSKNSTALIAFSNVLYRKPHILLYKIQCLTWQKE